MATHATKPDPMKRLRRDLIPERLLGPAMRAVPVKDRAFVWVYLETGNQTAAAEAAGKKTGPASRMEYNKGPGAGLRTRGYEMRRRPDIAAAIAEEAQRRLAFNLPMNLGIAQKFAEGKGDKKRGPVPYGVQTQMIVWLTGLAGVQAVQKHEVEHRVELTVSEQFAELVRLGKSPEEVLKNLPADEKAKVLALVKQKDGSYG